MRPKKKIKKHKVIKFDKPIPPKLRKAIEDKKEYMRKFQSGEIQIDESKIIDTIE